MLKCIHLHIPVCVFVKVRCLCSHLCSTASLTAGYVIAIAILYIVAIAFSTGTHTSVSVRHERLATSNTITLLCQNDTTGAYFANAEFLRNGQRIDYVVYGNFSGPNTSATLDLTPPMEGVYSCRVPGAGITSNSNLELAGIYTWYVECYVHIQHS